MSSTPRAIVTAVLAITVFLLIGARPALAQSDNTGVIDGRVADESKAPVPGATVTARNTATGSEANSGIGGPVTTLCRRRCAYIV